MQLAKKHKAVAQQNINKGTSELRQLMIKMKQSGSTIIPTPINTNHPGIQADDNRISQGLVSTRKSIQASLTPPQMPKALNGLSRLNTVTRSPLVVSSDYGGYSNSMIDNYKIGARLGKGAYAEVRKGVDRRSGKSVAIKVYERVKLLDLQRKQQVI